MTAREPSVPPVAPNSPGPVPQVPLRSYADPVANAEVQRLRAENERLLTELDRYDGEAWDSLRAKVARVEALHCDVHIEARVLKSVGARSAAKAMRDVEHLLSAALADPEEDQ